MHWKWDIISSYYLSFWNALKMGYHSFYYFKFCWNFGKILPGRWWYQWYQVEITLTNVINPVTFCAIKANGDVDGSVIVLSSLPRHLELGMCALYGGFYTSRAGGRSSMLGRSSTVQIVQSCLLQLSTDRGESLSSLPLWRCFL